MSCNINFNLPKTQCVDRNGGIYNLAVIPYDDINNIVITPITGALDDQLEGTVTAINILTGKKFYYLNPISGSNTFNETTTNGVVNQTITAGYPNDQLSTELAKMLGDCKCGFAFLLFYKNGKTALIYGSEPDTPLINNSPLFLSQSVKEVTNTPGEADTFTCTFTRENGGTNHTARFLNMTSAAIAALFLPAP
jgi:hypothetical protein